MHQSSIDDLLPQKNLEVAKSWRHLRLISTLLKIGSNATPSQDRLMRLIVLKGCQWAFDLRTVIPPFREFVDYLNLTAKHILTTCHAYREFMNEEWGDDWYTGLKGLHQGSIAKVVDCELRQLHGKVDAIITSPPYPGVHMLYGRWQVFGRRETELPLWIIGTPSRLSEGTYTMHSRRDTDNTTYFAMLHESMRAARMLIKSEGYMIQMVGFSEPSEQLPTFIRSIESSGFKEVRSQRLSTARDGRLWRAVPRRKWYTKSLEAPLRTKSEVVLIFRASSTRAL